MCIKCVHALEKCGYIRVHSLGKVTSKLLASFFSFFFFFSFFCSWPWLARLFLHVPCPRQYVHDLPALWCAVQCPYRHSVKAKESSYTCPDWKAKNCLDMDCPYKHPGNKGGLWLTWPSEGVCV